jgi:hypothetical protein
MDWANEDGAARKVNANANPSSIEISAAIRNRPNGLIEECLISD